MDRLTKKGTINTQEIYSKLEKLEDLESVLTYTLIDFFRIYAKVEDDKISLTIPKKVLVAGDTYDWLEECNNPAYENLKEWLKKNERK